MADLLSYQSSDSDSETESGSNPEMLNPFRPIFTANYPDSDTDSQPDINSLATDLFSSSRDSNSLIFQNELNGVSISSEPFLDNRSSNGLRVVEFDSDSDPEPDSGSGIVEFGYGGDNDDDGDGDGDDSGADEDQVFWDSFRRNDNEGDYRRMLANFVEEVFVMSGVLEAEFSDAADIRRLEMESFVELNTLERALFILNGFNGDSDVMISDGVEYDTLLERLLLASEVALRRGSPPAAKLVLESLPLVELGDEDLSDSSVVCAVCKDEVMSDEIVRKLPCCHYYHDECIGPWLKIRNTCPVCRYELPTDDPEYELRKNSVFGHNQSVIEGMEVRYGL